MLSRNAFMVEVELFYLIILFLNSYRDFKFILPFFLHNVSAYSHFSIYMYTFNAKVLLKNDILFENVAITVHLAR